MYAELQGKVYSGDPDYDTLRGRIVAQRSIVGITLDNWKVRHTVVVMDFGKPARPPVDPDEAMRVEGPGGIGDPVFAKQPKTVRLLAEVRGVLGRRPMTAIEIADALGYTVDRVKGLIRNHPEEFAVTKRTRAGCWYVCA